MKKHMDIIGTELLYTAQRVPAVVTVTDVREAYGRLDYEVRDVTGNKIWVSSKACKETTKTP